MASLAERCPEMVVLTDYPDEDRWMRCKPNWGGRGAAALSSAYPRSCMGREYSAVVSTPSFWPGRVPYAHPRPPRPPRPPHTVHRAFPRLCSPPSSQIHQLRTRTSSWEDTHSIRSSIHPSSLLRKLGGIGGVGHGWAMAGQRGDWAQRGAEQGGYGRAREEGEGIGRQMTMHALAGMPVCCSLLGLCCLGAHPTNGTRSTNSIYNPTDPFSVAKPWDALCSICIDNMSHCTSENRIRFERR
ncbi:hypothetical protein CALCODRAFT_495171 [Calocera cornea HHB12733]|uniref:Uncharacterized protein n=1 Tax=Calocera cornea HHB12733 TaxID=1353952 RepID=A0A165GMG0_9BASI|nr:hypothetical protein CALCODRAFT_495171 [Calocera cornea HHB12733]